MKPMDIAASDLRHELECARAAYGLLIERAEKKNGAEARRLKRDLAAYEKQMLK